LPNGLVRAVAVDGLSPSLIAVARRRTDHRRAVHDFVDAAVAIATDQLELLPGATAPS
jgi:hypothetical protein